jgi:hypothetical protein
VAVTDAEIAEALMRLARARAPDGSFCPSEAARALHDDWRPLMPEVRRVAGFLPLVATQKGGVVDAVSARGPIRLRLASGLDRATGGRAACEP